MNYDEVMQLPDDQLDAAVHEHIFRQPLTRLVYSKKNPDTPRELKCYVPAYSTDRLHTMTVVDAVGCSNTWTIRISSEGCSVSVAGIPVLFSHDTSELTLSSDRESDFGKIVCRLALLALACDTPQERVLKEQFKANNV